MSAAEVKARFAPVRVELEQSLAAAQEAVAEAAQSLVVAIAHRVVTVHGRDYVGEARRILRKRVEARDDARETLAHFDGALKSAIVEAKAKADELERTRPEREAKEVADANVRLWALVRHVRVTELRHGDQQSDLAKLRAAVADERLDELYRDQATKLIDAHAANADTRFVPRPEYHVRGGRIR
jgi:hypothetical protein